MEIDTNFNWGAVNNLPPVKNSAPGTKPVAPADSFDNSSVLEGALQNTPDIRPEAVASGRALVNNSDYPSDDTVKKLSSFLASQLPASLD